MSLFFHQFADEQGSVDVCEGNIEGTRFSVPLNSGNSGLPITVNKGELAGMAIQRRDAGTDIEMVAPILHLGLKTALQADDTDRLNKMYMALDALKEPETQAL